MCGALEGYSFQSSTPCDQSSVLNAVNTWSVAAEDFTGYGIVVAALDGSFTFTAENYTAIKDSSLPLSVRADISTLGLNDISRLEERSLVLAFTIPQTNFGKLCRI